MALELQEEIGTQIQNNFKRSVIFGLEHPSVITLGRRATPEEEIKVSVDSLNDLNIQCYKIDRGGHATLHSPGQLVIYPVLKLSEYNLSIREYLCVLQKTTLDFLRRFGINAFAKEDSPGIYTEKGKIAFFGIRVKNGVTYHGLSINVHNDTNEFSLIKSCGANVEQFDQMSSYDISASLEMLFNSWIEIWNQKCHL